MYEKTLMNKGLLEKTEKYSYYYVTEPNISIPMIM